MTLTQRMVPADPAPGIAPALEIHAWDESDRGPANAIIAKLAQAIAEQNLANANDSVLSESRHRGVPSLGWIMALGAGSTSLWFAAILIGRTLL
jgi:hypothetical protein